MSIVSDFFAACVVVLAAVGQLDTSFGRGCWSFVGVTSVERAVMVSSSENSKSPFRGLECLRPLERGERCVAVATEKLYAQVKPMTTNNNLAYAPAQV